QIRMAVAVVIAEDRTDLARLVNDAAILGFHKSLGRVQHQQARSSTVEKIRSAVAVDVADRKRIALHRAADAVGTKANLRGNVLEPLALRRAGNVLAGREVESPFARALANLQEQLVFAGL